MTDIIDVKSTPNYIDCCMFNGIVKEHVGVTVLLTTSSLMLEIILTDYIKQFNCVFSSIIPFKEYLFAFYNIEGFYGLSDKLITQGKCTLVRTDSVVLFYKGKLGIEYFTGYIDDAFSPEGTFPGNNNLSI